MLDAKKPPSISVKVSPYRRECLTELVVCNYFGERLRVHSRNDQSSLAKAEDGKVNQPRRIYLAIYYCLPRTFGAGSPMYRQTSFTNINCNTLLMIFQIDISLGGLAMHAQPAKIWYLISSFTIGLHCCYGCRVDEVNEECNICRTTILWMNWWL